MSQVLLCSDLHLGHKNIHNLRKAIESEQHNTARIAGDWFKAVTKRDIVYVLGDAAFTEEGLENLAALPGTKVLVRGNHDEFPIRRYLDVFQDVLGFVKYKKTWLSHCPIHPDELRGKINIHGHVHYATVDDPRYFNMCPENTWEVFGTCVVGYQKLMEYLKWCQQIT